MRYQERHRERVIERRLRREQTPAERDLWRVLRRSPFKFRRQHRIDRYIVDFYCAEFRLAVEVDGSIHDAMAEEDAARTAHLATLGIRMIRFRNLDVQLNVYEVVSAIEEACTFLM